MQVGRRRKLHVHPSVRTSRVCRNPKSDIWRARQGCTRVFPSATAMACLAMSSASPAPAAGASTGARGLGALAPALQRVWWPDKFKPTTPSRYGGATNPLAFLLASEEALLEAGGDNRVVANWLPMALTGAPRTWLLHLPAASVASWEELRSLFPSHQATPTPPVVAALLGGSQTPPTSHHVKPFIRRVSAASTR